MCRLEWTRGFCFGGFLLILSLSLSPHDTKPTPANYHSLPPSVCLTVRLSGDTSLPDTLSCFLSSVCCPPLVAALNRSTFILPCHRIVVCPPHRHLMSSSSSARETATQSGDSGRPVSGGQLGRKGGRKGSSIVLHWWLVVPLLTLCY